MKHKTGEKVIEGNKLIAEFMGAENKFPRMYRFPDTPYIKEEDLQYHTSWDWLMPVVKKVGDVINPPNWDRIIEELANVDIEKCHEQIVLTLQWYNQQIK